MIARLALLSFLALTLSVPAQAMTVAMLPLDGRGLIPAVQDGLDADLRTTLDTLSVATLQPRNATLAHINDAASTGLNCDVRQVDCGLKLGVLAGVDLVLLASAEPKGDAFALTLVLLDVEEIAERNRVSAEVRRRHEDQGASLRAALTAVWAKKQAALDLSVVPDGARVVVDDRYVGDTPLQTPIALAPGAHVVEVSHADHDPVTRAFELKKGQQATMRVSLVPRAPSTAERPAPAPAEANAAGTTTETLGPDPVPEAALAPEEDPFPWLTVTGAVLAGVGAVALIGGGGSVLVIEAVLSTPQDNLTYDALRVAGLVGIAGALTGVLAGALGAGIAAFGALE